MLCGNILNANVYYSKENSGLAGNTVYDIAIDRQGKVWIATSNGISTFDGTSWMKYTKKNSGLPDSNFYIKSIAVGRQDDIWFGSYGDEMYAGGRGISVFSKNNWKGYTKSNSGLIGNNINDLTFDLRGNAWIATNSGVSMFDGTNWTTYNSANSGFSSDTITSIFADMQGSIWIANGYIFKFDGKKWAKYSQNAGSIYCITIDNKGNIWAGTYNDGMKMYNGTNWVTYNITNGLSNNHVNGITIDAQNNVWVATNNGVNRFDGKKWIKYQETANFIINSIAIAADGTAWVGMQENGVSLLKEDVKQPATDNKQVKKTKKKSSKKRNK